MGKFDRLEVDEDEETSNEAVGTCHNEQPKLYFVESINSKSLIPSALPEKILEQLNKPQLEVVLWKPLGDFVKNFVSPEPEEPVHSKDKCESSLSANTVSHSQSGDPQEASSSCKGEDCMDSEPYDDIDDDMVL